MKKYVLLMGILFFVIITHGYVMAEGSLADLEIRGVEEIQSVFEAGSNPSSEIFVEGLELYSNISGELVPDKLLVDMGTVDFDRVGTYYINYYVLDLDDSHFVITTKEINVVDTTKPRINGVQLIRVQEGTKASTINYLAGISATDNDLSSNLDIKVFNYEVDLTKVGSYPVSYYVVDKSGNDFFVSTRLYVESNETSDRNKPMITLEKDVFYFDLNRDDPDYLDNVIAMDGEIDLTSEVRYDDNSVDYKTVGEYKVYFSVIDADGNLATKETKVIIVDDVTPPEYVNLDDTYDLTINTNDFLKNVQAIDLVWGDVTDRIEVTPGSDFDFHIEGFYDVVYTVSDLSGNELSKVIKVHVYDNLPPVITAPEFINIKINEELDLLNEISVEDNVDTNLTYTLHKNNLDLTTVGSYLIDISTIDSSGNETTKQILIYVYSSKFDKIYENPIILGSVVGIAVSFIISMLGVKFTKRNY